MKKWVLLLLFLIPAVQVQAQFGGGFFAAETVCLEDNIGYKIQLHHDFISGGLVGYFRLEEDERLKPDKDSAEKPRLRLPERGRAYGSVYPGFSYVVTKKRWRSYFGNAFSLNLTLMEGRRGPKGGADISASRGDPSDPFYGSMYVGYGAPGFGAKDETEKQFALRWSGTFSEGDCPEPDTSGWPIGDRAKFGEAPTEVSLAAAYPNPFNPTTTIGYSIPDASDVSVKVYDLMGREVADLVNDFHSPGNYEVRFDASHLSSGTYMYVLQAGDYRETRQMVLMK